MKPDIRIIRGKHFTSAYVGGKLVAVLWDHNNEFYVADGRSVPLLCRSRGEAVMHLVKIAEVHPASDEPVATPQDLPLEPSDEMVAAVDAAITAAAGTGTGEARAAARAVLRLLARDNAELQGAPA
jgi:hypothetical protein